MSEPHTDAERDDLDEYIAESMTSPAFREAYENAQAREDAFSRWRQGPCARAQPAPHEKR